MSVGHLQPSKLHTELCRKCDYAISTSTTQLPTYALQSHASPTRREAFDVQCALQRDETSIAEYADAIRDAELALERLRAQQNVLIAIAERKRAFLAPVRRLPTEILAAIINYTLEEVFHHKPDSSLLERHPVLRVCQRWRTIALGAVTLWDDIVLYPMSYTNWHETLQRCLQRSQARALSITLNGACPPWRKYDAVRGNVPQGEWAVVLQPLLASARRWRAVCFDSIRPPCALLRERKRLPQLEKLDLTSVWTSAWTVNAYPLFEDCPLLRADVRLDDVKIGTFSLPWGGFHTLELALQREDTIDNAIQCLSECKGIQRLTLTVYTRGTAPTQRLHCPVLQYLDVRKEAKFILPNMIAPGLNEIRVEGMSFDDGDPTSITVLRQFAIAQKGTAARIHSLSLEAREHKYGAYDEEHWAGLFGAYPGVRRLCVRDMDMGEAACALARILTAHPHLLPSLTLLKFYYFQLNSLSHARALGPLADVRTLDSPAGSPKLVIEITDDFEGFGDGAVKFCREKEIVVENKRPEGSEPSWQDEGFPAARPCRWPNYVWQKDKAGIRT